MLNGEMNKKRATRATARSLLSSPIFSRSVKKHFSLFSLSFLSLSPYNWRLTQNKNTKTSGGEAKRRGKKQKKKSPYLPLPRRLFARLPVPVPLTSCPFEAAPLPPLPRPPEAAEAPPVIKSLEEEDV